MNLLRFALRFYVAIDCIRDAANIDFSSAEIRVSALLKICKSEFLADKLRTFPCNREGKNCGKTLPKLDLDISHE